MSKFINGGHHVHGRENIGRDCKGGGSQEARVLKERKYPWTVVVHLGFINISPNLMSKHSPHPQFCAFFKPSLIIDYQLGLKAEVVW